MKRTRIGLITALTLTWITAWAAPIPLVTGDSLSWPAVTASTINVHRGDGSYVESLPGDATSWTAPEPGEYFLVAADRGDWRDWPRSETVTIEAVPVAGAPMPVQDGMVLRWPEVVATRINVHYGDGSYIQTLPGNATTWSPLQPDDYFLVATNEDHWSSWPRSATVTVIDPSVVSAVTGLSARVYSHTAAELFWDRKAGAGNRYRVSVNGEEAALTDGTSWFSDNFLANSTSVMSVVAIDASGYESTPRSVIVTTPGDTPTITSPTISQDNYQTLLADIFGAYFGSPYLEPMLELEDRMFSTLIEAASPFDTPYTCVNAGQATFEDPYRVQFDNCRIESAVYTGDFHIGDRNYYIESVNGLTITTDTNTEVAFEGIISDAATRYHYDARDINATVTTPSGELQLENADNQYSFPHLSCCYSGQKFLSDFDGNFLLRSPNTGNQLVNAETLLPFDYSEPLPGPADWNYRTGVLSVTADDGSRMILNADSGDDDTVSIQLINGDEMDEFEQTWMPEWSVWQQVLLR